MAKLIKFSNPVVNFEGLICLDFNQHFLSVYDVEAGREDGSLRWDMFIGMPWSL
ncbi:MAG: hypothetical protein J1E95_02345 [Muribaculaceae bacterium]|nr:hypothetical protein [Muribaculaceae bacterium]